MRDIKGRFTKEIAGENNPKWKGDGVGYFGLHTWVYRSLGKAKECVDCGSSVCVHWANVSKQYKRDLSDWKELCSVCHRKFDGLLKFSESDVTTIKSLSGAGMSTVKIARMFSVNQSSVWRLLNGKTKNYV